MTYEELLRANDEAKSLRELIEIIFNVIMSYHSRDIDLPPLSPKTANKTIRWTPSFSAGGKQDREARPYTMQTVAQFLGRTQDRGKGLEKADGDVRNAFSYLMAAEQRLISPELLCEITAALTQTHHVRITQGLRTKLSK